MRITVQCSPDADDLFMMRALLDGLIDTGHYVFEIDTSPTDALNRIASGQSPPEVCAISAAYYPQIAELYQLLPHGGSMGEGYGPVVIAPSPLTLGDLKGARVAIPGLTTTAWMTLRMIVPGIEPVVTPIVPYARIFEALRTGEVDAGLVIHEGRLTYEDEGFTKVVDIGEWWAAQTQGLPLPLGANAIRRDLGGDVIKDVSALLRQAIAHGLAHRDEAIDWLLERGGALRTPERVSRYLDMYANGRTLDYGPDGRRAMTVFFDRACDHGILDVPPQLDYAP
jgi:1,4-dihydroxy-6-naphthoate synthase